MSTEINAQMQSPLYQWHWYLHDCLNKMENALWHRKESVNNQICECFMRSWFNLVYDEAWGLFCCEPIFSWKLCNLLKASNWHTYTESSLPASIQEIITIVYANRRRSSQHTISDKLHISIRGNQLQNVENWFMEKLYISYYIWCFLIQMSELVC